MLLFLILIFFKFSLACHWHPHCFRENYNCCSSNAKRKKWLEFHLFFFYFPKTSSKSISEKKFWNQSFWFIRENKKLLTKNVWIRKTTRSIFNNRLWREQMRPYKPKPKENVLAVVEVLGKGVTLNEQNILSNVDCSSVSILRLTHWTSLEVQGLGGANTQRSFCYTREMLNLPILMFSQGFSTNILCTWCLLIIWQK